MATRSVGDDSDTREGVAKRCARFPGEGYGLAPTVMAGLVPAIHAAPSQRPCDVRIVGSARGPLLCNRLETPGTRPGMTEEPLGASTRMQMALVPEAFGVTEPLA